MDHLVTFSITVFTGFFAIMNPISNLPIFLSLVGNADKETKLRISKRAVLIAFIIVAIFVILGKTYSYSSRAWNYCYGYELCIGC